MVTDACLTHHPKCPIHFARVHTVHCVYTFYMYTFVFVHVVYGCGVLGPGFLPFFSSSTTTCTCTCT